MNHPRSDPSPLSDDHRVDLAYPSGRIFQTVVKPWLDEHIGPMCFYGRPDGQWDARIVPNTDKIAFRFRTAEQSVFIALRWRGEDLW